MAGDAELRELPHLAPGKQLLQVGADHAGERDEQRLLARHLGRHPDQARQHARHLDDGDLVLAAEGVLAAQANDEVQRLVRHLRKRMGRIQPHGNRAAAGPRARNTRAPIASARRCGRRAKRFRCLRGRKPASARRCKARTGASTSLCAAAASASNDWTVYSPLWSPFCSAVRCGVGPHLEELVQVGRDDAQVAQALQQRHVGAARPVEHPLVESQDAVVAVEERDVRGRRGGFGTRQWRRESQLRSWSR